MFGWFKSTPPPTDHSESIPKVENFINPTSVLEKFTAITGIHFNQKEPITASKLIHFCRNHQIYSFEELYSTLERDRGLLESLINVLTVNETYFFRESRQIFFLADHVIREREKVRILCAPSSTGEEPYSIAIVLLDRGVPPERIEIVSLDINSDVIALAKEGRYSVRSLHKTPLPLQEKYFTKVGDRFKICDRVKSLVTFHTLNVFDDHLFELGHFDIIFSRNMLIYFDEPTVIRTVERFSRLARSRESLFFFGHADFVKTPPSLAEHYEDGIKFYTLR